MTVTEARCSTSRPPTSHDITVQASDGDADQLADLQPSPSPTWHPATPVDGNAAANTVAEGAANGDLVGITASASDVHGGTVTFSLTDDAGGRFAIDAATGVVTVANAALLDFETATSHDITVRPPTPAAPSPPRPSAIAVTDVAPSTPVDGNAAANTVAEGAANGDLVGITASASDVNGGTVTFSLTDNAGGRFAIDAASGVVTVANAALLDFETATSHNITVTATDGALTSSQTFTIAVTDVARPTPVDGNAAANTVSEGAANGDLVGVTASASDVHGGTVTFALSDDAGGRFAIDASTGVVTVANGALLNYETATSHNITVKASDGTLRARRPSTSPSPTSRRPAGRRQCRRQHRGGGRRQRRPGRDHRVASDVHGGTVTFA